MPLPPIPFAPPRIYDPTSSGVRIADLIMRQGDIAARGAAASGQIWGNAVQQLGQIGAQAYKQHQQEQSQKKKELAVNTALQSWDGKDPLELAKVLMPHVGPKLALETANGMSSLLKAHQQQEPDPKHLAGIVGAMAGQERAMPGYIQRNWSTLIYPAIKDLAPKYGIAAGPDYQPDYTKGVLALDQQFNTPKTEENIVATAPIVNRRTGQVIYQPPDKSEKPNIQALDTKNGKPAFVTPSQIEAEPTRYQPMRTGVNVNLGGGTSAGQDDTQELADGLRKGTILPSTLSKRGNFNHIMAVAARDARKEGQPFNPVRMQLDYESSKRFIGSMNGNQMVRFKGLASSVVNTMDEVKSLAELLKQGSVQKWNQATRDTIVQLYGNTPQSEIAVRYVTAVNTLKEEFANLAQGGFAPTESAWKLAEQQINSNYGVKDFVASVNEAQRLINYRIGAFDELQPTYLGGQGANSPGGNTGPAAPAPQKTAPKGSTKQMADDYLKSLGL